MSATCAITDKTGQWGETSIAMPRVAVGAERDRLRRTTAPPSPVDGADLVRFLRVAYAPPQTEEEVAAQFGGDLLEFLRDFSSTAPRPMVAGMTSGDYKAPRRVPASRRHGPPPSAGCACVVGSRELTASASPGNGHPAEGAPLYC